MSGGPPTGFFAKLNLGLKKDAPSASTSEPKRLNVLVQALSELELLETLGAGEGGWGWAPSPSRDPGRCPVMTFFWFGVLFCDTLGPSFFPPPFS